MWRGEPLLSNLGGSGASFHGVRVGGTAWQGVAMWVDGKWMGRRGWVGGRGRVGVGVGVGVGVMWGVGVGVGCGCVCGCGCGVACVWREGGGRDGGRGFWVGEGEDGRGDG